MLETKVISLDAIEVDPNNPRDSFPDDELERLSASFERTPGRPGEPFTPILVVKLQAAKGKKQRYRIVDGERRYRAMSNAGKVSECTCTVADDMDDANALLMELATDDKKQLTAHEKSRGYQQALLMDIEPDTIDSCIGVSDGTAKRVKTVVEQAGKPMQIGMDTLFKMSEIRDVKTRGKLIKIYEKDGTGNKFSDALRKAINTQTYDDADKELVECAKKKGISFVDEDAVKDMIMRTKTSRVDMLDGCLEKIGGDEYKATFTPHGKVASYGWCDPGCITFYCEKDSAVSDEEKMLAEKRAAYNSLKKSFESGLEDADALHRAFVIKTINGGLFAKPGTRAGQKVKALKEAMQAALANNRTLKNFFDGLDDCEQPKDVTSAVVPFIWHSVYPCTGTEWIIAECAAKEEIKDWRKDNISDWIRAVELFESTGYEPTPTELRIMEILKPMLAEESTD